MAWSKGGVLAAEFGAQRFSERRNGLSRSSLLLSPPPNTEANSLSWKERQQNSNNYDHLVENVSVKPFLFSFFRFSRYWFREGQSWYGKRRSVGVSGHGVRFRRERERESCHYCYYCSFPGCIHHLLLLLLHFRASPKVQQVPSRRQFREHFSLLFPCGCTAQ